MQEDIDFFVLVVLGTALSTFWVVYQKPTQSVARQWSFIAFAVVAAILSGLYILEHRGSTALTGEIGGPFAVLTALCLFLSVSAVIYTIDLYLNVDDLRNDQAYNLYGDAGLAGITVLTVAGAFYCLLIPWFLADPTIFEIRTTIRYLDGVETFEEVRFWDLFLVALDQTGKAILFDIAEVYRFGLTNLSNNPEHLTFSTVCLVYRTLVAVYVTVIALRLIFAPK